MKFFSAVGRVTKFVLYAGKCERAKQNVFHYPGKYTETTYLHSHSSSLAVQTINIIKIILNNMYICNILKFTKRSRNFFAMQGIEGGLSDLLLLLLNEESMCEST